MAMIFLVQTGFHNDESFVEGIYEEFNMAIQVIKEQMIAAPVLDYGVVTMFELGKSPLKQKGTVLARWERQYTNGMEEVKEVPLEALTEVARIVRKAIEERETVVKFQKLIEPTP